MIEGTEYTMEKCLILLAKLDQVYCYCPFLFLHKRIYSSSSSLSISGAYPPLNTHTPHAPSFSRVEPWDFQCHLQNPSPLFYVRKFWLSRIYYLIRLHWFLSSLLLSGSVRSNSCIHITVYS